MNLPFEKNSDIITYNNKSFPLGIIQSLGDKVLPWLYNKYINCVYFPNQERQYDLCMEDWWFTKEKVFSIQLLRLSPKYLKFKSLNVISIIEECIDNGIYIYGFLNEKYIPNKYAYNQYDFTHEYLLYGYDKEKRGFSSVGYNKNNKYEEYCISYNDYIKSIECMDSFDIYLVQLNNEFDFSIDIEYITQDISEYLSSSNTREDNKKKLYGLNCWRHFIKNTKNDIREKCRIDIRHTRLFMEHKNFMLKRIEYLKQAGYIKNNLSYKDIQEGANKAYLLSLKYNMTHNNSIAEKIINLYNNILIDEEKILKEVLIEINSNLNNII